MQEIERKLLKAIGHLKYSFNKVKVLSPDRIDATDEILEVWEGFASRFSRVADLYLSKYLRSAILKDDPGFRGSFRDFLDRAEKLGLIDSVDDWLAVRELRNLTVHEYEEENLKIYFSKLIQYSQMLLDLERRIVK